VRAVGHPFVDVEESEATFAVAEGFVEIFAVAAPAPGRLVV